MEAPGKSHGFPGRREATIGHRTSLWTVMAVFSIQGRSSLVYIKLKGVVQD